MQFSELSKSIFNLLSIDNLELTEDGPKSIGFFPLTQYEFQDTFQAGRLNVLRELETMSPPLSIDLKKELLKQINSCEENLENKREEISLYGNQIMNLIFSSKMNFCKELKLYIENDFKYQVTGKRTDEKFNANLTLRQLAMLFIGLNDTGILTNNEAELKKIISEGFTYKDGENNIDVQLQVLKGEFSKFKNGADGYSKKKSISEVIKKLESVLSYLRKAQNNEELAYEAHKEKNKINFK